MIEETLDIEKLNEHVKGITTELREAMEKGKAEHEAKRDAYHKAEAILQRTTDLYLSNHTTLTPEKAFEIAKTFVEKLYVFKDELEAEIKTRFTPKEETCEAKEDCTVGETN